MIILRRFNGARADALVLRLVGARKDNKERKSLPLERSSDSSDPALNFFVKFFESFVDANANGPGGVREI